MKKKLLRIIKMLTFIFTMHFVYCTDEEYAITVEDYHHELETRLKIYKEYEEDITAHEYTLFSVTRSDIGLHEVLNLFGALYGNTVYKDKVTVFTIRKSQTWDSRDADEHFNKFVSAVRNCDDCIYNFELMKRLGISIDFIDWKYIEGYSAMYKNADQIIERHKKLEEIMVFELEKILLEAFTLCFMEKIRPVVVSYLVFRRQLEPEDVAFTGFFEIELNNLSSGMIGLSDDQILKNVLCMRTVSKNGSYMAIRHKILEYEKNTMFKHFTNNAPAILNFVNNICEHKYREIFCQGVRDLVSRNVPQIMCQKAKYIIVGILKNRCKEIYGTVKDDRVKYDALVDNQDLQMNKIFCECKLLEDCENFIDGLHLENEKEIYTREYAVIIQKLVTEVYLERISRVLFLDELTDENKYHLCRILRDTKILENLQSNQIILIDGHKSIPHELLSFTAEKYETIRADLSINAQTIEVFTKFKSIKREDVAYQEYQVKSFRRDLILGDDSGSVIKVVNCQEPNIASIYTSSRMINGHDDEMILMMGLFKDKLLSIDHNSKHTIFYISVNIRDYLTLISIVHHKFSNNGVKEGYSIFYNLPCQHGTKDSVSGQTQQRQVKWFGCVPISFIADLYSYLYFLLHSTPVEFTIPHQLLSEKQIIALHTTKTLECYYFDNLTYHVRNNIANLYGYVDLPCSLVSITEKDILDFEQTKTYSRNENVTKFVKSLGISESDFNRIANAFVIGKNRLTRQFETLSCAFNRTLPYETICFYTFNTESSVVLNICEVVVGSYKDKLIDNAKLLTRMLNLSESLNVAKEYAYFAKCKDSKLSLIVSVIHEISHFMQYDTKENCLEDAIISNQFEVIFKKCFLTYYEENVDHDDFIDAKRRRTLKNRRLRVSNIEKLMDDEKIKNFVETLKTEFIALQTKKVMKVTSIKIDKGNGQIMHDDTYDLGLICNIEQYNNLEYLVYQTC